MSQKSRNEYLEKMRDRYRRYKGRRARSKLITEFCEVTGHERKYGNKLLSKKRGPGSRNTDKKRGVARTYCDDVVDVIFFIWQHSEQPCGKRLRPMLADWLPHYERRFFELPNDIRSKILSISPAQIDRLLADKKVGASRHKQRTPKANAAIKALVPVRAESWDAREPGWIEADTVAHCGGSMAESFIWSLTATDIFSGWTEVRPSWNRGKYSVCEAFIKIEAALPFEILGVDTDNGGEFLNYHLHAHFTGRKVPIEMTRSRPYRKNDQAHVEQKNDTHVRQLLGYDRLGHDLLLDPVRLLLESWCVFRNCFTTTFKQLSARREGNRIIRRHEKVPKTPCQRIIEHCGENGDEVTASALEKWRSRHDPFEMKAEIEARLKQIWELDKKLSEDEDMSQSEREKIASATIWEGHRSYAPMALPNRKYRAKKAKKPNQNQDVTETANLA
ncbi:MAG: transposase family protein [Methylococcales bacterium]|nr:transposase family protein [Methylococcales bacterium]